LVIDSIQGDVYGGSLSGRVEMHYGDAPARYELKTTVHDMDIQPFIYAARSPQLATEDPVDARGFADVRLYLSGPLNDKPKSQPGSPLVEGPSHVGGGRVEIREADLYRLPIMLAILNVINLAVPDKNAFHDVSSEFRIRGNRVALTDIVLQGPVLKLVGDGSISLPDRGVDLHLVNVPPLLARVPGLGGIVEGASRELVELHVTGPLFRPTVRPKPFRATIEELKRLFQKKKPKTITAAGS
jgi:hypothetical protein